MINRIKIMENDSTGIIPNINNFNVVLIPGFADGTRPGEYKDKVAKFELCPQGTPIICNSVDQFKNIFGYRPAVFYNNQPYPENKIKEEATETLSSTYSSNSISDSTSNNYLHKDVYFDGYVSTAYISQNVSYSDNLTLENLLSSTSLSSDNLAQYYKNLKLKFTNSANNNIVYDYTITDTNSGKLVKLYNGGEELGTGTGFDFKVEAIYLFIKNADSGNSLFLMRTTSVDSTSGDTTQVYSVDYNNSYGLSNGQVLTYSISSDSSGFDNLSIPTTDGITPNVMFAKGQPDPSYIYAVELLSRGMPVAYVRLNSNRQFTSTSSSPDYHNSSDDVTVVNFYTRLKEFLSLNSNYPNKNIIVDADTYPGLKYITSGGYPTLGWTDEISTENTVPTATLSNALMKVAAERGDCIALIDHTNNPNRVLFGNNSVYFCIGGENTDSPDGIANYILDHGSSSFGAIYTPWAGYALNNAYDIGGFNDVTATTLVSPYSLPASFDYLCCIAELLNTGDKWATAAGVNRGINGNLVRLDTTRTLTSAIADYYQCPYDDAKNKVSINAITNINPYGLTIWGNRTLFRSTKDSLMATSFINIRSIICDIKKYLVRYAKECMFEQNTDILFGKFSGSIATVLDTMQTSSVLAGYSIERVVTTDQTKVACIVTIYPTYAIESFDITVNISDQEVIVD